MPRLPPSRLAGGLVALAVVAAAAAGDADAPGASCAADGEHFPTVPAAIPFVGPGAAEPSPLAFRYYEPDRVVLGKPMREWMRFSLAYWHTMRGDGRDPFGAPTKRWPWDDGSDTIENAQRRLGAFFELVKKLGVQHWCFHDRDLAPAGRTPAESRKNLETLVRAAAEAQKAANASVLWGTAQLFAEPHYAQGAATSPVPEVFAHAAAQVRAAMDATHALGGRGYVFWGGREGYQTLLNTDMELELRNMAALLRMAADYRDAIGFEGVLLIEPKPQEPTKHQYDWDVATTAGFLARNRLLERGFQINVECNHATLSGHSCFHELETARVLGILGNVDANVGDAQTGWDTDEFLTDPREAMLVMLSVVRNGGLPVGFNFDAKLRRESTDPEDLAIAHVSGMDALARGLLSAARLVESGALDDAVAARYERWSSSPTGRSIADGTATLASLADWAEAQPRVPPLPSGRQEWFDRAVFAALV